jgi:hypothetical protein
MIIFLSLYPNKIKTSAVAAVKKRKIADKNHVFQSKWNEE